MHRAFTTTMETGGPSTGYTNDELVAYLVQCEWDDRHNRRIERLTKSARFRYTAVMEAIDYRPSRQLDKNLVRRLGSCGFIQKRENILITGSTGVGKSYLASIGHQACSMGSKTMYFNTAKLFTLLKTSKADGSYPKQINKLEKQDLLILDDFGLKPLDNINRHALMEIIEDRHGKKPDQSRENAVDKKPRGSMLFNFDRGSNGFELLLRFLGLVLSNAFLDRLRRTFDEVLGVLQAQRGHRTDFLN